MGDCVCKMKDPLLLNPRSRRFTTKLITSLVYSSFILISLLFISHLGDRFQAVTPNYEGCANDVSLGFRYCDSSLGIDDRVASLVNELNLSEKISLLTPDPTQGNPCDDHTAAVPRIGLPSIMWLTEVNSMVDAVCVGPDKCPTVFYGPLGSAASFNTTSWRARGYTLGMELRAFRNVGGARPVGAKELVGLTGFGPNINIGTFLTLSVYLINSVGDLLIARDPRFGRTSELPGEDPLINGKYAAEMIQGMQTKDDDGFYLMLGFLKHFSAYSVEEDRFTSNFNISKYDLADTYLRQFKIAVTQGKPAGVMCSYNSINGTPSCANGFLLNTLLRQEWKQPDIIVTSDCDAIKNLHGPPAYAPNELFQSSWALNNGTDLEMGTTIFQMGLARAVRSGLTNETIISASVQRLYKALMRAGQFQKTSFDKIGDEVINSTKHQRRSHDAALQGPVLLRNNVLPLQLGSTLSVIGPFGNAKATLFEDYSKLVCHEPGNGCVLSLYEALQKLHGNATFTQGTDELQSIPNGVQAAITAAMKSDYTILVIGSSSLQEAEGTDKNTTDISTPQLQLARAILSLGRPTVILLVNGGALSIDELANSNHSQLSIVELFNPGPQTRAIAQLLTGKENRWGKLPYTIYPSDYQHEISKNSFSMSVFPGRTYRYFMKTPLWPFGFGLSYTDFAITELSCADQSNIKVTVKNIGLRRGDEVLQAYHSLNTLQTHPLPIKTLFEFERVRLEAGEFIEMSIPVTIESVSVVDNNGNQVLYHGNHSIFIALGTLGGSSDVSHKCTFEVSLI